MGELIVVTGPPGAGKSSVCAVLADKFVPSALVAGDAFFAFLRRGYIPPWQPAADQQNTVVTEAAASAAGRLCGHCWVVYDGVVGPWFLPVFARSTGLGQIHYVALLPPMEVCLERVRTRTGHGFTDLAAARHMYTQFATAGIEERHLLIDPDSSAASLATRIHDCIADGSLVYRAG
jgi:cytidylate kinase